MKEVKLTQEDIDIIYNDILIRKYELQAHPENVKDYLDEISMCDSILKKLSI